MQLAPNAGATPSGTTYLVTYQLSDATVKTPIVIEDCDVSREPMYCRKVKLRYRRGCEKIEVIQARK